MHRFGLPVSRITVAIFAGAATLLLLAGFSVFSVDRLIVILNSLFIGTSVTVAISFWRLFRDALFGGPYDRVHIGLAGALLDLAILFGASGSIYTRMFDLPTQTTILLVISRFLAIFAAVLQVTAPDFGHGLFYGRDRRLLIASIVIGIIAASVLMYGQEEEILAAE